jgi:predicted  nucleic acid-binding Zn-ribbon protein
MPTKIDEVLEELGSKISSIEGKVTVGRQQVSSYKKEIVERLKGVVASLAKIQDSSELKQIPELRGKLLESNRLLDEKNKELEARTNELSSMRSTILKQEQELKSLNDQIDQTTTELGEAKAAISNAKAETDKIKNEKEQAISDLTTQLTSLKQEKDVVEKTLSDTQAEMETIVGRITTINANLQKQIDMIDTITSELNIDGPMTEEFQAVTDNIAAIMSMLQGATTSASSSTSSVNARPISVPLYDKYNSLTPKERDELLYKLPDNIRMTVEKDYDTVNNKTVNEQQRIIAKTNIQNSLKKYAEGKTEYMGGRRRRKTMKKRRNNKRHSKKSYKGGYVYSFSKELDKASSVISASTSSSGSSRRRNNSKKRQTRRKSKS